MKKSRLVVSLICMVWICIFILAPIATSADETYPNRPIKLVVCFSAGGPTDLACRKLAEIVSKDLGQEVYVEQKLGGGGLVGNRFIAFSKPDGYTIGSMGSASVLVHPHLKAPMDFDPVNDFTPIAQFAVADHPLVVPINSPIKTIQQFIEEGRKRQLTYAGTGNSAADIQLESFAAQAKIKLKIVPFGGMAPSLTALLGGHTDAACVSGLYKSVRDGQTRLLAQTTATRNKEFPDIPTLKELGYDVETRIFYGIVGPKGIPEQIRAKLEKAFSKAIHDPSFPKVLYNAGYSLVYRNSKDFGNYIKESFIASQKQFKELGLGKYAKE
jgi:tripartite-type tricarboxylate transporter receptor subunit TctC